VLVNTFKVNDLYDFAELLLEEIEEKKRCINQDFETMGRDRYFLIAEFEGTIIGSIEYGLSNDLLNECTNYELKDLLEIGTVFVLPNYQKKGISSLLLESLFQVFKQNNIKEFCFDSGYKIAQKIWCKRFGEPEYFLKDYWGKGSHHMVWRVEVK
jgi:GNAT superfamily N-acetyltransferase